MSEEKKLNIYIDGVKIGTAKPVTLEICECIKDPKAWRCINCGVPMYPNTKENQDFLNSLGNE